MDMSDFTAGTVGTGQYPAVDDDTSADTGSQSNGYQIGIAFTTALPHFAQGCYIGIVACLHGNRQIQFFFQRFSKIKRSPADINSTVDHEAFGIYRTGGADSHAHQVCCGDVLFLHFIFDGCCDIRQNFLSAVILDRRDLPFVQHLSFVIEQS